MTLQALLFDVDGMLADTERDGHRAAFNRAFAAIVLDHLGEVDRPFRVLSHAPVNGFLFANLDFLFRLHAAA